MPSELHKPNIVITDASCFILLDKINALDLLKDLYSTVLTTPEIAVEFKKRLPDWVQVIAVANRERLYDYADNVDIGEASAIALAFEVDNPTLILDDMKGRNWPISLISGIQGQ
jgi:predicted nucleic acid-binding protein